MAKFSPRELAAHLKSGLLSFPATAFTSNGEIDEAKYREHIAWQSSYDVGGLFAAGGTGEGFSLTSEETARVVALAVAESHEEVPVLGSAAGSTRQAVQNAKDAETVGAEGILVLPPYLTECAQEGLYNHVAAICAATTIGVIVYNRANAVFSAETVEKLAANFDNFIGFKDATGNIEHLTRVFSRNGDRLFYLGGLPTAEMFALPLLQLGMSTYSSAMFNFVPEFALSFYHDIRAQNHDAVTQKLNEFVIPFVDIREKQQGYGVSIIKAGLRAVGRDNGPVRAPLQDLTEAEAAELKDLIVSTGVSPALSSAAAVSV